MTSLPTLVPIGRASLSASKLLPAGVLAALLFLTACIGAVDYLPPGARVRNDSGVMIEVYQGSHDTALLVTTLDPREEGAASLSFNDETGCGIFLLVARDEEGLEVDRHDGPICIDELWVVDNDGV